MSEHRVGIDGIFSVRCFSVDFYMHKPASSLDTCYSEFRGREIKRVPIIRVFGSTQTGEKTCLHVHGVFPYFYIPYEQKNFESLNKAIYQVATNVDKAINISLGQGSSNAQHIFKIQLVKGIPFYGYHNAEHQFLKIYMFNPRFVRRAANLLQNGSIMGKTFNPFESHVPYILQFMIDYNLYGMSLLHVPEEVVKFRRCNEDDDIPYHNVQPSQILSTTIEKKISTCALEADISSGFILNRFQLLAKTSGTDTHTNPGIESIWNDERLRRQHLATKDESKVIPPLEIPVSQSRPNLQPTESDVFYRTALLSKLISIETIQDSGSSADQTLNNTEQSNLTNFTLNTTLLGTKEQKRSFNLKQLLVNAVYPEECSQTDNLVNASFVENHLSTTHCLQNSYSESDISKITNDQKPNTNIIGSEDDRVFLDDTIVDEDFLLHLSQSQPYVPLDASLREEDLKLLEVLQQLEENNDNGDRVDLDSTLAPLSQPHNISLTPEVLNKDVQETAADGVITIDSEDEDDSNIHDFSVALDDFDEIISKLTQSQTAQMEMSKSSRDEQMPQTDGADDNLRTPTKRKSTRYSNIETSSRSPRSPRNQHGSPRTPKFPPLPIVILNRSEIKRHCTEERIMKPVPPPRLDLDAKGPQVSLRKRLALSEMRRKSISSTTEVIPKLDTPETSPHITNAQPRRTRRSAVIDLDKTHITCSLTPPRRKSQRLLKVYSVEANDAAAIEPSKTATKSPINNKEPVREKRRSKRLQTNNKTPSPDSKIQENIEKEKKISFTEKQDSNEVEPEKIADDLILASDDEHSETPTMKLRKTPRLRHLRRSFVSEKGSKHSNASPPTCSKTMTNNVIPVKAIEAVTINVESMRDNDDRKKKDEIEQIEEQENEDDEEEEEDTLMESFYEHSLVVNSPSVFSNMSSPATPMALKTNEDCKERRTESPLNQVVIRNANDVVVVTPLLLPPTYDEVLIGCHKFDLPEFEYQEPYYSEPNDITKRKEVGHTVLQLPGNKLNDCAEFESVLGTDICGINAWRRKRLTLLGGPTLLQRCRNIQSMREYFASNRCIVIAPQMEAPTKQEAKLWLKARELLASKRNATDTKAHALDEDSPIKVRRQKVTLMLNAGEDNAASDDEMDCSSCSLTLTPLTPGTPVPTNTKPVSSNKENGKEAFTPLSTLNKELDGSLSKHHLRRIRSQSRRSRRSLTDSLNATKAEVQVKAEQEEELSRANSQVENSQSSDMSVTSQAALAELERSSFVQQLHSGGSGRSSSHDFSLNNTFGFKVNLENLHKAKADIEYNYLTTLTLEVFVPTRGDLFPNPEMDEMRCMFYAVEHSMPPSKSQSDALPPKACGYIIVNDAQDLIKEGKRHGLDADIEVRVVQTEIEAIQALLELCQRWDPDIFAGYEIEMSSWGFVMERAKFLCLNIGPLLSRIPTQKMREFVDEERDSYTDLDIDVKLCGRVLLDVWRLMRSEIALTSYTFENVTYHILHKRCPSHSYRQLTEWFSSSCTRWIVLEYYLERVRGTLALLEQLDLIGRTSEMAKLIGIQFYEVFSRGSQFRVESMMLRMAKPKNMVPFSPSVQQRAHMRAPEYLSLIMEPQSRFYADPMIVLDFQSLYPSIIIAYNYCFSTCLGRVEHLGQSVPFEFAASQLRVSPTMLRKLIDRDLITISPCGVVFVKASVREGIMPRMLTEILDTRQMVKQSMKLHKNDSALQRILHSRQLGLKLMANVTYGYTAANFSGRMPAVEVGDSVVSKGRETLERAIKLVEANDKWNVKVVYGDTDSMFVLVPGRSREQAFKIGEEIVEAVTQSNPQPIKLKLEKVYQPCILQTKKRYVGYMYETPDQAEPVFEAKGIETVRRDGCPIASKMLEKVLRILFESADVSQVKRYVCRQFTKLLSGRANVQDLIFAKEFRGLKGYKPTACVPALEMTRKWLQTDPRRIPRSGERVPFIIINGPPGVPLIRLVRSPHEMLADGGLKINALYYITKAIIPPLNRCLLLIGADVNEWFTSLPRKILLTPALGNGNDGVNHSKTINNTAMDVFGNYLKTASKKSTISQYFSTINCIVDCGRQTKQGICSVCSKDTLKVTVVIHAKITKIERAYQLTQQICQACVGRIGDLECNSLDCPVLYVLEAKRRDLNQISYLRNLIESL